MNEKQVEAAAKVIYYNTPNHKSQYLGQGNFRQVVIEWNELRDLEKESYRKVSKAAIRAAHKEE